ncbi:MAG: carbon-nitrogen hydrolase family protein [Hyphomicrobiaceae bacterium]
MKVAVIQVAPAQGQTAQNREELLARIRSVAGLGAEIIACPECAVSGYAISSESEARERAEPVPGPSTRAIEEICSSTGCHVVCGLLEIDQERLYNTAVLIGPEGVVGRHRKAHIVRVAADAFVALGNEVAVFEARGIKVGMSICYEVRFPELARTQALLGARLLVVAANWPAGADVNPSLMAPARAAENNLYVLAANRTGVEGSLSFLGRSAIFGPDGKPLVSAGIEECTLMADIELTMGLGPVGVAASGYDVDLKGHRRPELYAPITLSKT